ncbi:MAG: prephenate dehydrogenase/arogenate dehydrogenase family protein [Fidelibacterota bacterium]
MIEKITIVGVGLMGGSLGLALKRKGIGIEIVGIDEPRVLNKALELGAIDSGFEPQSLREGLKRAHLTFLAVPISRILKLIPDVAQFAEKGTIVTDVGSTKNKIVDLAAEKLKNKVYFIGGHPMAGSERKGIEAADPFLFENVIWILTPIPGTPMDKLNTLSGIIEKIGAKTVVLDSSTHDEIAAGVSHLPQFIAVALVNMIGKYNELNPLYLKMAAGGFRDVTRIASSPFEIWEDICRTNFNNIARYIDLFINQLKLLKRTRDPDRLKIEFQQAALNRLSIPRDTKGFIKPLRDIFLSVEDKPGVIALISTTLAEHGINIKDIEVLKVREGEGGTLRLALESERDREESLKLLRARGIKCGKRD